MNVVFDLAGVVFDWRPAALIARTLPHRAPDDAAAEALARFFFDGFGGDWAEFDRGTIEPAPLARRIAARTGLAEDEAMRVIDAVPPSLVPIDGTVSLIEALKSRGHGVSFLSNMPAPYADHLERTQPVFAHFDGGVFSSRVHLIKPEPEIFRAALQRLGASASDCVFIDDYAHNVEAAQSEGWQALLFTNIDALAAAFGRLGLLDAEPRRI